VSESALAGLVVFRFQGRVASGFPAEMTCHARTAGSVPNTGAIMAGGAAAGAGWWDDAATRALFGNGSALDRVVVQDLSPAGLSSAVVSIGLAGTRGTGAPVATQDSLVITKNTGLAGPGFRGRMYSWGALAVDLDAAGGLWDQTFADAWTTAAAAMDTALALAAPTGYSPCIWHRTAGTGGSPAADSVTDITSYTGRTELAVIRSRRS
jgi:hypothetical protein